MMMFEWRNSNYGSGSIFTASTVQQMCQVENAIFKSDRWRDYCVIQTAAANSSTVECVTQPQLVTSLFYPSSSYASLSDGAVSPARTCSLLSDSAVTTAANEIYSKVVLYGNKYALM